MTDTTPCPVAVSDRLQRIHAKYGETPDLPIPPEEDRECEALDYMHRVVGRFRVEARHCLRHDTITWRGWYWSLQSMAECGQAVYPLASFFAFADKRPLSGIKGGA